MSSVYSKKKIKSKAKTKNTSVLPKVLFVIMAALGCLLIWGLKFYGASAFITVAVPVSFIFLYCGLAWQVRIFYIREDIIGDNAYYLGFLYTLSSLAYALWRFQVSQDMDPANIIGSFGVALWSTIFGIVLRVFFSQLRQDVNEIEKDARVKVAETASILSNSLYQASITFNDYTRSLQQSVDEVFVNAKDVSKSTIKALEDLNKKMGQIEAPDSIINRKIDSIFHDLENVTKRLNSLADGQTKSVESLVESSGLLVNNINVLNTEVAGMKNGSEIIGSGKESIHKVTMLVSSLQEELSKLSDSFRELYNKNSETVEGIVNHTRELEGQLTRSRQYTEETHKSLASMTKTLAEKLQ